MKKKRRKKKEKPTNIRTNPNMPKKSNRQHMTDCRSMGDHIDAILATKGGNTRS